MELRNKENTEPRIPNYDHLFGDESKKPKTSIRIIFDIMKEFWGKYLLSLVFYCIKSSPLYITPLLTAEIINIASRPIDSSSYKMIAVYGGIIAFFLIQNVPTHMVYAKLSNTLLRSFGAGLRCSLMRKLQRLSLTYHRQIESGKLQSKFIRDIDSTINLMATLLTTVVQALLGVIISVGMSLSHSVLMTLFFVAIVPLNIFLTKFFYKKIAYKSREFRKANESVSASFTSMLRMMPITKAHGLEKKEISEFKDNVTKLTETGLEADMTNAHFGAWIWVMSTFLSSVCLIFTAILALNGKIAVGDIVLYQSLFGLINSNVSALVNVFPTLVSGMESISSLSEVMTSDDIEREGDYHLKGIRGVVDFNHVSYAYPDCPNKKVIDDFDLHVKSGECIAFVGSSGSGKTTVINMIIGYLRATNGDVQIDGRNINDIRVHNYRHHISVVPQNNILFPGTIRENITYGLERYTEEELSRAVEMANINEFLPLLPNGLDTQVGEEGDMLSGGQRQRITIARALIRDPAILILDEATSALDNVSEFHIQKAIEQSISGRTTFIVAHRLSTIRNADRIVVMEKGKMIECGSYQELMELKGKFFELKSLSDMATKEYATDGFIPE